VGSSRGFICPKQIEFKLLTFAILAAFFMLFAENEQLEALFASPNVDQFHPTKM
jgi:hypothetical protein